MTLSLSGSVFVEKAVTVLALFLSLADSSPNSPLLHKSNLTLISMGFGGITEKRIWPLISDFIIKLVSARQRLDLKIAHGG